MDREVEEGRREGGCWNGGEAVWAATEGRVLLGCVESLRRGAGAWTEEIEERARAGGRD